MYNTFSTKPQLKIALDTISKALLNFNFMDFLYVKALHIIFVVTWFAGLFYMVRLFIYHAEAEKKPDPAKEILQTQYQLMEKRLWYIITWPSAILASFFAFWLLYKNPIYLEMPWMHVKLSFVLALYFYQGACHKMFQQFQKNNIKYSSFKLRIWNEVATIILFAIVFLVVLKSAINWVWGVVGILLVSILLMLSIRLYKKIRAKKNWDKQVQEFIDKDQNSN
ncbi:protoporphyrinogen IX oxidase [Tenacibaculum maritimum]|nr:protoporphyrinogen IX oxidase [Tenacibaculum maritimum]CAA0190449.1 protoporphyrinogen IX oxidase [Tenacibaculum maritimum]CAA0193744.1 protoporphyrinogen IX oxidase [Tenacibaculum maritimum]CAA0202681.1 protoporphyrinogen IX oxidase [Tenacibaculum maritimum]CAA0219104.1 protoporphyrinogen IX oxidase [Tenacibaculum maritimum]